MARKQKTSQRLEVSLGIKYYKQISEQHNSTRMITDDTGTIVYSSAHNPYGVKQKTWVNTYEPKLQFSGKERETYSDLDYFGARYYGQSLYRFASVDPIIDKEESLYNPQLWNLYAYCRNNPLTYFDTNGDIEAKISLKEHQVETTDKIPNNPRRRMGVTRPKVTKFGGYVVEVNGKFSPRFLIEMIVNIWFHRYKKAHEWRHARDMVFEFIVVVSYLKDIENKTFSSRADAQNAINEALKKAKSMLENGAKWSAIRRDFLPFLDSIDSFFDSISSSGHEGKGVQREIEFKD